MEKLEVNVLTLVNNYARFNREFMKWEKIALRVHKKPPFLSVYRGGRFLCRFYCFKDFWAAYCEKRIIDLDRVAMYYEI